MLPQKRNLLIVISAVILFVIIASLAVRYSDQLNTQVTGTQNVTTVEKTFTWTPSSDVSPGMHTATIVATDNQGNEVTKDIKINVLPANGANPRRPESPGKPSDPGSSGSNGPGRQSGVNFVFEPNIGHTISGDFAGIEKDGNRTIATLPHNRAVLEKSVEVPAGDYWFDISAKHDEPGPVDVAIYLDDRIWKIVRLAESDNKYRTHRIGKLRNLDKGKVRFQFLNDAYDRHNVTNPDTTRNFSLEWWRLTTEPGLAVKAAPRSVRSPGWELLPRLNQFIRSELGDQFAVPHIWKYYANRLTASPTGYESIQTEGRLISVMKYWRITNPSRPRGNNPDEQPRVVSSGRSGGWQVLPKLNQIMREELGSQHVIQEIWSYYAQRLTINPSRVEVIQSEAQLRNIMKYWRQVRPDYPRGNDLK